MEVFREFCEYCGQDKNVGCGCSEQMKDYQMTIEEFNKQFEKEKDVVDRAIDAANQFVDAITQEYLDILLQYLEHDDECDVVLELDDPECQCEFPYLFFIFSKETGELLNWQGPILADYFRGCSSDEVAVTVSVWIGMLVDDLTDHFVNEINFYSELWTDW